MKFSEVTVEYAKNRDQALPYKEPGTSIYDGSFCGLGIMRYRMIRLSDCISVLGIIFQHPRIKLKAVSLFHSHYLKEYRLGTGTSFVLYSEIQAEAFRKFCTEPKFSIHI